MSKGKIIVVEGACDGIGKSTQYQLLEKYLLDRGEKVIKHHFPTYNEYQGKGVESYLKGDFGVPGELSPYFINNLYASDRAITWYSKLKKEYDAGKTILLDRYTTSTLIYQASLIKDKDEKNKFLNYISDLEYEKIGIGKPDKVIFLTASFDLVTRMRNERKVNDGVENDVHERDLSFMKSVYNNAIYVADYFNWDVVECSDGDKMKSIEEIHEIICKMLNT